MASSFTKPLKVAVVGTGYFSRFHYAAWQRMPDVEVVALHALNLQQGKAFQSEFGIETLIYRYGFAARTKRR